jgi:hypothetical protein
VKTFVLCVLVQGLLPPGENPIAVKNNNKIIIIIKLPLSILLVSATS